MRRRIPSLIAAALLLSTTAHAEDCIAAKQYLSRAQAQVQASQGNAAVSLLHKSIAACPSYEAYETLAELLGHSSNRRDWASAADAFVEADARAPDPKARAQTLYQYASLVNDDGDPQNAWPMIKKAHALAPGREDISGLSATIEKEIQAPKKSQLVRSFGLSVYKPLRAPLRTASSDSGGGGGGAISGAGHRQVNILINFGFDSVEPNEQTRSNVTLLADALVDPALAGKQFVFIGHSDSRGDPVYNTELSRRRADAIRSNVLQLEPALAGHIGVEGKGSSEPLDPGTDAAAMRANRRLQVIVK